jgi:AcrR family transcriptional regulator
MIYRNFVVGWGMTPARRPRRLTKEARHQQLVALAMPVVAEQGFGGFSLEQIAEQADITRNNLYRYFPRGRPDIVVAVVTEAGRALTKDWVTDPELSLEQRLQANMTRIAVHAFGPSDAWRIHRKARADDRPEIAEIVNGYLNTVVSNISVNNLGTSDPPPGARAAILATIAFGETMIDESRGAELTPTQIGQIILDILVTALHSSQTSLPEARTTGN